MRQRRPRRVLMLLRGLRSVCAVPRQVRAVHACAVRLNAGADRAEQSMQRFWKDVHLAFETPSNGDDEHFVVQLDRRNLRTPGGAKLAIPADRPLLACLIAQEWDEQTQLIKPHSLPLTSLMSRAIDALQDDDRGRKEVQDYLMRYLDTDTVCFFDKEPARLVQLQKERWTPLLEWTRRLLDADVHTATGTLVCRQPDATRAKVERLLAGLPPLDLASLERAVMVSKSMIIGLALIHRYIEAEQAALAAEVETASQVAAWGVIDDSHDVDHAELRRQLASVACAQVSTEPELVEKFLQVLKKHDGAFRT